MTLDEYQILLAEAQHAANKIMLACQVAAAQNFEARTLVELQKTEKEKEISTIVGERNLLQSANFIRPSIMHPPILTKEDDEWIASYGHLRASGPTPETAYQEFDRLWVGKDEL